LLSYVTIANFRHKHKGKALAGGLVHANVRALRRSGCGPPSLPRTSGPWDSRKRNDNRVSAGLERMQTRCIGVGRRSSDQP